MNTFWQKFLRANAWSAMAWFMAILVIYSFYAFKLGWYDLRIVFLVVSAAIVLDYALHVWQKTGRRKFPKSGLISALIILILLPAGIEPLPALAAAIFAVASKHFLLWQGRHVFNPAAFGVLASMSVFNFPLGWRVDGLLWLVFVLGAWTVWRVKKYWQIAGFLAVYVLYLVWQGSLSALNQYSLYLLPWFFALFILPEPMTSPAGKSHEAAFGALVAAFYIAFSYFPGTAEMALLLALVCGNLFRFILPKFFPAKAAIG